MSKTFQLFGRQIIIDDKQIKYNELRLTYQKSASKCADEYLKIYNGYISIKNFSDKGKGLEDGFSVINKALQETLKVFVDAKIYNIDENAFIDKYGDDCFNDWVEAFQQINDKYMEIILEGEKLSAYRTARRQNRGKIIGGGFGLQGAVKGIVTAGAINLGIGLLHGVFNIGAGILTALFDNRESNLYNSQETKKILWSGIYNSVFNLHYACCDIFKVPVLKDEDIKNATSIFNNFGRMNQKEEIIDNLLKIIKTYPYKSEFYQYCIANFGDNNCQVEKMAEFFGLDLKEYKNRLLADIYKSKNSDSENGVFEAKKTVETAMVLYGMQNSPVLNEIAEKLSIFDKNARTVDNVIYNTRDEAELARKELLEVQELIKNEEYKKNEENAKKCLKQLEKKVSRTALGKKSISEVTAVVKDFEIKSRTVDGIVFKTIEEAETAVLEQCAVEDTLKGKKYEEDEEQAKQCLSELKKANFKTEIGKKHIEKIEKVVDKHDRTARTFNEKIYDTRQEAERIKKDIEGKTVEGFLCDSVEEADEIKKILPIVKEADQPDKFTSDFYRLTFIIEKINDNVVNKELLKPYLLSRLGSQEKEEFYQSVKNYQEKKDSGIAGLISQFVLWALSFIASYYLILYLGFFIGGIIVIFGYIGGYAGRKYEKLCWDFFTNDGRTKINDLKCYERSIKIGSSAI